MLDIDEAAEVLAAASRFTGAATGAAGRIATTVDDLELRSRPESALDRDLVAALHWVKTAVAQAVQGDDGQADATYLLAVARVDALTATDVFGGVAIDRYESA
ncbi:hypothetical protein [Nocardia sp. NPDC006630]|uniref:hypothetical protein n=1 Tax=Nocardia sp. NPDC006630 TaxID=3157181 RepID=UPI0033BEEAEA